LGICSCTARRRRIQSNGDQPSDAATGWAAGRDLRRRRGCCERRAFHASALGDRQHRGVCRTHGGVQLDCRFHDALPRFVLPLRALLERVFPRHRFSHRKPII
jgi:hypothetical protein